MSVHRGRTDQVKGVFLGEAFWEPNKKIIGKVVRAFESENGSCYTLKLSKPIVVGEAGLQEIVAIGALKGFQMAMDAAGLSELRAGDTLVALCTAKKPSGKASPMVEFEIEVTREDA